MKQRHKLFDFLSFQVNVNIWIDTEQLLLICVCSPIVQTNFISQNTKSFTFERWRRTFVAVAAVSPLFSPHSDNFTPNLFPDNNTKIHQENRELADLLKLQLKDMDDIFFTNPSSMKK